MNEYFTCWQLSQNIPKWLTKGDLWRAFDSRDVFRSVVPKEKEATQIYSSEPVLCGHVHRNQWCHYFISHDSWDYESQSTVLQNTRVNVFTWADNKVSATHSVCNIRPPKEKMASSPFDANCPMKFSTHLDSVNYPINGAKHPFSENIKTCNLGVSPAHQLSQTASELEEFYQVAW